VRNPALGRVVVNLLGECRLTVDGRIITGVPAHFFRIAAYLILSGVRGIVPRQKISTLLWLNATEQQAAANLRQALARIRHVQDEHGFTFVEGNFSSLYLVHTPEVACDLGRFADDYYGRKALSLEELCEIYTGDLLGGMEEASEDFEEWLASWRGRLQMETSERLMAALEQDADPAVAPSAQVTAAQCLLSIDPYNEHAVRFLMQEAAKHGQAGRLKHLYAEIVTVLANELGIQPSAQTQNLYRMLRQELGI